MPVEGVDGGDSAVDGGGPAERLSRDFVRLVTHWGLVAMPVRGKAGSFAKLVEALTHRPAVLAS